MIDVHVKFRDAECIVRLEAIGVNNAVGSNSLFDAPKKFRFLAVTLLLFWFFYSTEEERILAQFDELSAIASMSGAALTTADALVLENFRDLFAPKVSLKTGRRARLLVSQHTD